MYYELATMTLPFGTAGQAATNVQAYATAPDAKGELLGCWFTDIGQLNQMIVLRGFADLAQLQARLQCAYGSRILTLGLSDQTESFWLPEPGHPTRYAARDPASEQAALDRLRRAGFYGPDVTGRYRLAGESRVLAFFARDYPRLEPRFLISR